MRTASRVRCQAGEKSPYTYTLGAKAETVHVRGPPEARCRPRLRTRGPAAYGNADVYVYDRHRRQREQQRPGAADFRTATADRATSFGSPVAQNSPSRRSYSS
jgi:hypothetical protein